MPKLTWTRDPLNSNPRKGYLALQDYDGSSYHLSTGDGRVSAAANPVRFSHTYPTGGLFRAIARERSGGPILATLVVNFPEETPPQATITQHPQRPYLPEPPYHVGNVALEVTNADEAFLECYTVDWGAPGNHPEPSRVRVWAHPGRTIYSQQPPGTYTATVTNETTGASTQIPYTVHDEVEWTLTAAEEDSRTVGVKLEFVLTDAAAVTIDWGDNTHDTVTTPAPGVSVRHTYATPGVYEVFVCQIRDGTGWGAAREVTIPVEVAP